MKKIIYSFLLITTISGVGCKKFVDVNKDPNRPVEVTEKLLLAPIEYAITHNIAAGGPGSAFAHLNQLMQNTALNQPIPNVGTYNFTPTDFNEAWNNVYVVCLQNLQILKAQSEKNGNLNYTGISRILTAYTLGVATDMWGDIPYSQAFKGNENFLPAYDKQEDIYKELQSLLDNGIADINKSTGIKPGNDDMFYAGDMAKWKRLAFTLKARYHMHLTKVYPAAQQADLALAALDSGMMANADDLRLQYPGAANSENRYNLLMRPVETLILSSTIVDTLLARNDPRIGQLVAPAKTDNVYRGRQIGYVGPLPNLNIFSVIGPFYGNANSPLFLVTYSEALFLRAEATLIKSGAAAAQPVYQNGIRSHMTKLGISATATNDYINARGTLNAENALQRIMEEKNIANFLSVENYNDWRRTGFPLLTPPPNALSETPRRFLYPQSEINTNPQPQHSAKLTDRVWWDK